MSSYLSTVRGSVHLPPSTLERRKNNGPDATWCKSRSSLLYSSSIPLLKARSVFNLDPCQPKTQLGKRRQPHFKKLCPTSLAIPMEGTP